MQFCHMRCKTRAFSISMTQPMPNTIIMTNRTDVFCLIILALPTNSLLSMFCDISYHILRLLSRFEMYCWPRTQHTILCNHSCIIYWYGLTARSSCGLSRSSFIICIVNLLLCKMHIKFLLYLACMCTLFIYQSRIYHNNCKYCLVDSF